jgi:hypothetical protein
VDCVDSLAKAAGLFYGARTPRLQCDVVFFSVIGPAEPLHCYPTGRAHSDGSVSTLVICSEMLRGRRLSSQPTAPGLIWAFLAELAALPWSPMDSTAWWAENSASIMEVAGKSALFHFYLSFCELWSCWTFSKRHDRSLASFTRIFRESAIPFFPRDLASRIFLLLLSYIVPSVCYLIGIYPVHMSASICLIWSLRVRKRGTASVLRAREVSWY